MSKRGGTENVTKNVVRTTEEARRRGRNGGLASAAARRAQKDRIATMIAEFKVKPLTKQDMEVADKMLLSMNEDQLFAVRDDKTQPKYIRVRAEMLLSLEKSESVEMAERMIDRAFGKPRQAVDLAVDDTPPASVIEVATTID